MAAKSDMERIGVFSESGYTTIADPYISPAKNAFNESAVRGKQMIISGTKSKTASQSGYFDHNFSRILQGEAYADPVKIRRKRRLQEAKKNLGGAWIPSNIGRQPSGVGSHYGTFAGPVTAFSAVVKLQPKFKPVGKNFLTNPGKVGTGYGYVGVTIGPAYKHSSGQYDVSKDMRKMEHHAAKAKEKGGPFKLHSHPNDFFDNNPYYFKTVLPLSRGTKVSQSKSKPFKPSSPAKMAGGCKAGTFNVYPQHSNDPYSYKKSQWGDSARSKANVFRPSAGPKTKPSSSIMKQTIMRKMNASNFPTMTAT